MTNNGKPSLLLIDDNSELLAALATRVEELLRTDAFEIRQWSPAEPEDPEERFKGLVDADTVAVVTDYDLTAQGLNGLFGATIVSWCQGRLLPVADFSRGNVTAVPAEPNLFELRVPTELDEAAAYIATLVRGFKQIRDELTRNPDRLGALRSPAEALAYVLERPHLEGQLALYMSRLGASNSTLLDRLRKEFSPPDAPDASEKARLLTYVIGHVLVNSVIRYPGPILTARALCAYLGTSDSEFGELAPWFAGARYEGPFSSHLPSYWRRDVDAVLDAVADVPEAPLERYNRSIGETHLARELARHNCDRCGGVNGGYLCPFTDRAVCDRSDCSVAANSWVPAGADLCRIEREFYDEWAPLIGL